MRRALDFRSALPILPQARMNIPITFQESHVQVCALIADFREREAFYLSVEDVPHPVDWTPERSI